MVDRIRPVIADAEISLLEPSAVAAAVFTVLASDRGGEAWYVPPGRPAAPFAFRGIPGPRDTNGNPVRPGAVGRARPVSGPVTCRGTYQVKPELPFTPGVELCGIVETVGEGVTAFSPGDRVVGSSVLPSGAFAEYALMAEASTFAAADSLEDAQAGSLYLGYQTSGFALHRRACLRDGEWLLVHAAAGGVGSSAVQLGKAAGAARPLVSGRVAIEDVAASVQRLADGRTVGRIAYVA